MEIPAFGFNELPEDQESSLMLFIAKAGTISSENTPVFPTRTTLSEAVTNTRARLTSMGFRELGALKDDTLLQVAKGSIKTNYSTSRKRECNFTLLNAKGGQSKFDNINKTIAANGCFADFAVLDRANGGVYCIYNLEIESGVKITDKKYTELPFKANADSFMQRPLTAHNLVEQGNIMPPDTEIK